MPSLALASLFPVLSRGLNGPAQEVQRTCKIVENPSAVIPSISKFHVCEDEVGVTSLTDGGVLWAHAWLRFKLLKRPRGGRSAKLALTRGTPSTSMVELPCWHSEGAPLTSMVESPSWHSKKKAEGSVALPSGADPRTEQQRKGTDLRTGSGHRPKDRPFQVPLLTFDVLRLWLPASEASSRRDTWSCAS